MGIIKRWAKWLTGVFPVLLFLACLGGSQVTGEAGTAPEALLKSADECRQNLLASEKMKKYRQNWLKCVGTYSQIYTRCPKSDEAAWAFYHAARLYRDMYDVSKLPSDVDEAQKLFERLIHDYPTHRLADDAQFAIGEIQENCRGNSTQASLEYLKVTIQYPKGDMRPYASKRLESLAALLDQKAPAAAPGEKNPAPNEEPKPKSAEHAPSTPADALGRVKVTDLRHWSTPTYTRVVVELEAPVEYQQHILKADPDANKPRRFYLDLKNAFVTSEIDTTIPVKDDLLQRVRAGQYNPTTVRIVLDTDTPGRCKVFHLYDPFKVIIDVQRLDENGNKTAAAPVPAAAPAPPVQKRRAQKGIRKAGTPQDSVSLAQQLGLGVNRVVIDPGHGGKDPGCTGYGGLEEKDLTLEFARTLARRIKKDLGCEVILTRDKDLYLPLERRTAIANMKKADLFISLHVNAHKDSRIEGLETYFLNMALDENAMKVAARENATSEKNISDLQRILNDLMLNTKINESNRLAHKVQEGMVDQVKRRYGGAKDLGVKQAPFYVLIGAQMPAILVETGFITNADERKRLPNAIYRERVAEGITRGIKSYIQSMGDVYRGG